MKKIVLTFGLIGGAVLSAMMLGTLPFADRIGFDHSEVIGYTSIVLASLFVFFGIRSYRENVAGGTVSFGRAFTVGILITTITCICYVVTWELIYFKLMPDFADKYGAYAIERARASGASPEKLEETVRQMAQFKQLLDNPLVNGAIAFIEPFPIGLIVTIVSALALRKKGT